MEQKNEITVLGRLRKFFTGLFEKLDKKMEEEAKSASCGCKPKTGKGDSCCS